MRYREIETVDIAVNPQVMVELWMRIREMADRDK